MIGASQSKVGSKAKHKEKPIKHKKPRQAKTEIFWYVVWREEPGIVRQRIT